MRLIITLTLLIISNLCWAQTVVTIQDSVQVKKQPRETAETIRTIQKGYLLHLTGEKLDAWRQTNIGWVDGRSLLVVREESIVQQSAGGDQWYIQQLASKNPAELTATEIQYLIYSEMQNTEKFRRDISAIKTSQVIMAAGTVISLIGTAAVLLANN